jgi:hypothetical protein
MGVFKMLVGFLEDHVQAIRKFWWREKEKKTSRVGLILTNPKGIGGMGFIDSKFINRALLACQTWRLIDKHNSLGARGLLKYTY